MGKCNTDPSGANFTWAMISFLPVSLHFLLQSRKEGKQESKKESKKERKKERKKDLSVLKTLHSRCVLHTIWMIGRAGFVEDVFRGLIMWSVSTNGCSHQNERGCDYTPAGVCGWRQTLQCTCDFFFHKRHVDVALVASEDFLCCLKSHLPLLFPPLITPQGIKLKWHIFSLSLSLSLSVQSELVVSCLVRSRPIQSSDI